MLGANAVLMDAYKTDVRPMLADARAAWDSIPIRSAAYARSGYAERIAARAGRRPAGGLGRMSVDGLAAGRPAGRQLLARSQPAGSGSAQHELRRRQHVGQGHGDRPGDRNARRAAVGQGLRRRPRHADRGGTGGPAARPAAGARRRLPRRRARGRDGRRVRLLPSRPRRRGAVDRHRDARAGRGRPRRPPAPGLGHRPRDGRGRRGADPRAASATASRGCRGGGPGFQLGLDIAAIRREHPAAIGAILGGHGITAWGDTSAECEANSLEIIGTADAVLAEHGEPDPFGPLVAGFEPLRRLSAARGPPRCSRDPRPGLDRPAAGRPLHRQRRRPRFPRPGRASAARCARHVVPRPLPPDEGPAAGRRPAADRRSTTSVARLRELHAAYRD